MTAFESVEEAAKGEKVAQPKPETRMSFSANYHNRRLQYLAGFLATIPMFVVGNFIGWTSPILPILEGVNGPFSITESQGSWVASIFNLGSVPGAFLAGFLSDKLGRRSAILISAPIFSVSWIICYFSTSATGLYVGRFMGGFGYAIGSAVCSPYIAEISDTMIRGRLCGLIMFMNNFGVVAALAIGPYVSYYVFIIILALFPVIHLVTFLFMPESPYFCLKEGNRDRAMKAMMRLRGIHDDKQLEKELDYMQLSIEEEMENKTSFWELVRHPVYRKALIVVLGVKTMQHFSGVAAIQSYMQQIFDNAHSFIPSAISGIVCGSIQMAAGLFSSGFMDSFGRKPLLLFSSVGCAVSLFSIGLYFFLQDYLNFDMTSVSWLPLVSIMVFMAVQPIGVGNLSYVLLGELFPTNVKGAAAITATVYGSSCAFLVVKLFEVISTATDISITFWLCMCFVLGGILFTIYYVPETKGRSLQQIQIELNQVHKKRKNEIFDVVV